MKQRFAILAAALAFAPLPAAAADLAQSYPLPAPEIAAPECARYGYTRPYDDVYQPPQTAYILASRCQSFDVVGLLTGGQREKLLVYYNGGSMYKTDIDMLVVPR